MQKAQTVLGILLLAAGASAVAMASVVPEIPVASAGSAIALVSGMLLVIRGRRRS
jgi:ABC-type Na+ efflux pump permease subunit